jgi:hypothetical protein
VPPARIRFAGEAAFLVLVAIGLALGQFDPIVIGAVILAALVLVALLERASRKEAARASQVVAEEPLAPPPPTAGPVEGEPPVEAQDSEPTPKAEREATVDERSARAILASGPPPLPREATKPKGMRRLVERRHERRRTPEPTPAPAEAAVVVGGPAREWNLWELERAVRNSPDESQREEWNALLIHLREFANADGDLPVEFDGFVRDSFAAALAVEREPAATP